MSIPVTINDTAGRLDCSFSVSFDNTKLEYAGKTSGDMGATLLTASIADINAAGKVQPIVQFEEGGATSGTITAFKFNIKPGAAAGVSPLTIGDITPADTYTGVSGSITIKQGQCTDPAIAAGTETACKQGDEVEIPITIEDTAGEPDLHFTVAFDKTKLQFTGTDSGTMGATILSEKPADANAAGKVGIIARFATATSGTIVKLKFTVLADLTADLPLTVGDIVPADTFCGENGAVEEDCIATCTVTIEPETATVECGALKSFTSTTTGTCGTLEWSVTTTIGSTVTQNGVYRAGRNETTADVTDTVKVTSASTGESASAVVTVPSCPPGACEVNISPKSETVECGNEIQFIATSTGTSTCEPPVYTWSITTTIGSTITQNGLYKAGENTTGSNKTDIVRVTDTANDDSDTATVTVGDCTIVCSGLTPSITQAQQGVSMKVKLVTEDEIFKGVKMEDITVDFGSGITVNKIKDKTKNSLKVQITIDANATVGTRTILVTAGDEKCAEGQFRVILQPTVIVIPSTGRAGEKIEEVTINGARTHFEKGNTKVKFGDKIEVDNVTVVSPTQLTCKIKISSKAEVGSRQVLVNTKLPDKSPEVAKGTFVVLPAASE